jgi:hypothetical protein
MPTFLFTVDDVFDISGRYVIPAPGVKGSVLAFCNFTFHCPFFRATASRFETLLQLPIASRSATHFNVIVVSRRNRTAIATFPLSPLARSRNSTSPQPRRRNSSSTIPSAFASADARTSSP